MRAKFLLFINFCAPRLFRLPGQSLRRAAGHRAGAVFFARHLDSFFVTRNFAAIYRDWSHLDNFIVTRNSQPFTGTGKKQVTATQTAPNQTAGPLGFIAFEKSDYCLLDNLS
jgi:hypothetical protein